jgi:hypothetical protein
MDYVQPKRNLGTSLVSQGSIGRVAPDPLPHGFGRIVAVSFKEICDASDLNLNASLPPDTNSWSKCRFLADVYFPIDERARGTVADSPSGLIPVDFVYVSAIVHDSQIKVL